MLVEEHLKKISGAAVDPGHKVAMPLEIRHPHIGLSAKFLTGSISCLIETFNRLKINHTKD